MLVLRGQTAFFPGFCFGVASYKKQGKVVWPHQAIDTYSLEYAKTKTHDQTFIVIIWCREPSKTFKGETFVVGVENDRLWENVCSNSFF